MTTPSGVPTSGLDRRPAVFAVPLSGADPRPLSAGYREGTVGMSRQVGLQLPRRPLLADSKWHNTNRCVCPAVGGSHYGDRRGRDEPLAVVGTAIWWPAWLCDRRPCEATIAPCHRWHWSQACSLPLCGLAVTRLQPLGANTLSMTKRLSFVIVPLLAAFTLRSVLDNLLLQTFTPNDISRLTLRIAGALGLSIFIAMVLFPFYFMLSSSVKPRALLLQDPANLSINFRARARQTSGGAIYSGDGAFSLWALYPEQHHSGFAYGYHYPGARNSRRLRSYQAPFSRRRRLLSNSILLIYMFPAIVLVIPLYSIFTAIGLRNSLLGLLVVYPAMTIPVALYMLRSYFNTLPRGHRRVGPYRWLHTRLGVIWRITLPLSLPALASVGLYVFMIAWNEFLFAFMFLDDPNIFTLSRGVVSLNTQEVTRQYLMAGRGDHHRSGHVPVSSGSSAIWLAVLLRAV